MVFFSSIFYGEKCFQRPRFMKCTWLLTYFEINSKRGGHVRNLLIFTFCRSFIFQELCPCKKWKGGNCTNSSKHHLQKQKANLRSYNDSILRAKIRFSHSKVVHSSSIFCDRLHFTMLRNKYWFFLA